MGILSSTALNSQLIFKRENGFLTVVITVEGCCILNWPLSDTEQNSDWLLRVWLRRKSPSRDQPLRPTTSAPGQSSLKKKNPRKKKKKKFHFLKSGPKLPWSQSVQLGGKSIKNPTGKRWDLSGDFSCLVGDQQLGVGFAPAEAQFVLCSPSSLTKRYHVTAPQLLETVNDIVDIALTF